MQCRECGKDDLLPLNFPKAARSQYAACMQRMSPLPTMRCYPCGELHEAGVVNKSRLAALTINPCRTCGGSLVEFPPSATYLRNTRSRPGKRLCGRCMSGQAPEWSVSLRLMCKDWQQLSNYPHDSAARVLHVVIKTLGRNSIYRVPWRNGLHRIAIFLGSDLQRSCPERPGGIKSSSFGWSAAERCRNHENRKWVMKGYEVIQRNCCDPSWTGWHCKVCRRQR